MPTAKTIKEITKGNEFKTKTHTVALPNKATISRSVDSQKRSNMTVTEFTKVAAILGKNSTSSAVAFLREKNVDVSIVGSYVRFEQNHINKMLKVIWQSDLSGVYVYTPKKGFEQAIRTILGVRVLKSEYTSAEVKKFADNGILEQMFDAKLKKQPLQLPRINGYDGSIKGKNIVYGCASLPLAWFAIPNGGTRNIKSLTLSSGVSITETQVKAIYDYLAENKIK